MLKKIVRRTIRPFRPLLVRYRRFMQAEVIHEIVSHRSHEAAAYARSLESALLTIALHSDQLDTDKPRTSQSDAA